ncbi:MAG: cell wall anchor protein [Marmoricola sp.]|jgi:LPXTG-motif cell wall-anchored protein|nr:cell wall anchor protein [Marmoricola sp.]
MNKIAAGLGVTGIAALVTLTGVSAAHADDYVDTNNPSGVQVSSGAGNQGAAAPTAGRAPTAAGGLPSTGGPDEGLLVGGAALLVAGGATLVLARRRRTS